MQNFLTNLLSEGELIFSKQQAIAALNISDDAFRNSLKRQVAAGHVLRLTRGIYLIIPPEYKKLGFVPPEQFIDDLMRALGEKYYICLLSAASFYGATHQALQILQVMVSRPLKPIKLKRTQIVFYVSNSMENTSVKNIKTDRGLLNVSTPEVTCLDILKYSKQSGGLNQIATVLGELAKEVNPDRLLEKEILYPLVIIQRLGYILEILNLKILSSVLKKHVKSKKPINYSPLHPERMKSKGKKNRSWHLIINEKIESDL